jgi:hypothetical protein
MVVRQRKETSLIDADPRGPKTKALDMSEVILKVNNLNVVRNGEEIIMTSTRGGGMKNSEPLKAD